jgi:hypothetical protein
MMEEGSCRLDFVRGNAEYMAKEAAICGCSKCTFRLPDLQVEFNYQMTDEEYKDMKQVVAVQNISNHLDKFSREEKKKILEEIMINENINIEVAGNSPGSLKPQTDSLSIL